VSCFLVQVSFNNTRRSYFQIVWLSHVILEVLKWRKE
jgi:hypothetical protein